MKNKQIMDWAQEDASAYWETHADEHLQDDDLTVRAGQDTDAWASRIKKEEGRRPNKEQRMLYYERWIEVYGWMERYDHSTCAVCGKVAIHQCPGCEGFFCDPHWEAHYQDNKKYIDQPVEPEVLN